MALTKVGRSLLNTGVADSSDATAITISSAEDATFAGHILLADSKNIKLGAGTDLQLYHDGTNSYITNSTGALKIATETSGIAVTIGHTTSETTIADNLTVTGTVAAGVITADGLDMGDSEKIRLGAAQDLEIYHDGSHSYIYDGGTGNIVLKTNNGANVDIMGASEYMAKFIKDGAVELYYNDAKKLETTAAGITVTGAVTGNLTGDVTGDVTGNVTGNASGTAATVTTAAQTNITSLGTLTGLTGGTGDLIWDTPTFVVDSSTDRVGIGTASPANNLHIHTDSGDEGLTIKSTGDTSNAIIIDANRGNAGAAINALTGKWNGTSVADILFLTGADTTNKDDGVITFRTSSADNIEEKMRIASDGKVGIGTTSAAGMLHVDGHTSSIASIFESNGNGDTVPVQLKVKANNGTTSTQGLYGNAGSASTDNTITLGTDGTTGLTVNNGGNVGIGTTSPAQTLSVDASGGANLFVSRTGQTGGLYIESDGTNGVVRNPANNPLLFQTNGANTRMTILGDGNVGIGENAPHEKVHVTGASGVALLMHMDADTADGTSAVLFKNDSTNDDRRIKAGIIYQRDDPGTRGTGDLHLCVNGVNSDTNVSVSDSKISILADGKVGIGTGTPSYRPLTINSASGDSGHTFEVGGTRYWNTAVDTAGSPGSNSYWIGDEEDDNGVYVVQDGSSWSGISDERLKRNWTNLENATDKIKTLTKVGTFQRRGKTTGNWSDNREVGLSAQEVEAILPEAVTTGGDIEFASDDKVTGVKGMAYEKLVPLLVKSIQELEARIKTLEEA